MPGKRVVPVRMAAIAGAEEAKRAEPRRSHEDDADIAPLGITGSRSRWASRSGPVCERYFDGFKCLNQ